MYELTEFAAPPAYDALRQSALNGTRGARNLLGALQQNVIALCRNKMILESARDFCHGAE